MPYLTEIIARINTEIKTSLGVFPGGVYDGIAYQVTEEGRVKPAIDNRGELKYTGIDDAYPFVLYHRILSNTYETDKQFVSWTKSNTKMVLVVYAKRSIVKLPPHEFAEAIGANLPRTVSKSNLDGMTQINLVLGEVNLNPKQVFNTEYSGVEFQLGADEIFFSLPYTLTTTYNKDCIIDCCDGTAPAECGNATVENSDGTYSVSVTCEDTYELPDTTYRVYIGGVLTQSFTLPTLATNNVNIFP